jgi:DNA-binding GntR family transcriptional regulator
MNENAKPMFWLSREARESDRGGVPAPEDRMVERIVAAVMERRLPSGTKLSENALCEAFGVSRARVRRALLMLAERDIVVLQSNRGAFIASPTPEEARDVFEARRTIEPTIVRNAVARIADAQIATLKEHVERESSAARLGNRHEAIRLSGQFHLRLAAYAHSPVLSRFLAELVARTSLIIGLFGSRRVSPCSRDEHGALIAAVADRDAARAMRLMVQHLDHIEGELEICDAGEETCDLRVILSA